MKGQIPNWLIREVGDPAVDEEFRVAGTLDGEIDADLAVVGDEDFCGLVWWERRGELPFVVIEDVVV